MSDENIIEFIARPAEGDVPKIRRARLTLCPHRSIVLDEERRMIECQVCGQCFEPYEWCQKWAYSEINPYNGRKHAMEDIKRLHVEIQDLRKERASLKASIRRYKKA